MTFNIEIIKMSNSFNEDLLNRINKNSYISAPLYFIRNSKIFQNDNDDFLSENFPLENKNSFFEISSYNNNFPEINIKNKDIITQKIIPFNLASIKKPFCSFFEQSENSEYDLFINPSPIMENSETETQNQKIEEILELEIFKQNINKKPKFISKKGHKEKRIDYLIKKIKVFSSQKMTNYGNYLIEKCFENEKKVHLNKPNSKEYTSIPKVDRNRDWLNLKIEEIFTLGKDSKNGSHQKSNLETIKKIKKLIDESEISEKIQKLKDFLEMTLEDFYTYIFYDEAGGFKEFFDEKDIIVLDQEFKNQKGYSLLEKNALIKYFKYD